MSSVLCQCFLRERTRHGDYSLFMKQFISRILLQIYFIKFGVF